MFCLFIGRSIISCSTQSLSLYSLEYYPTSIRAIGLGSCSAISRLGAMSTPHVSLCIYTFFSLVAVALSLTLTIETKGRILYVIKNYFLILKIENFHFLFNIFRMVKAKLTRQNNANNWNYIIKSWFFSHSPRKSIKWLKIES
jgi:hypothetical protein